MAIPASGLGLYALGILLLWLTPGLVRAAVTARAISGGLASRGGVTLNDLLWPLCAIPSVSVVIPLAGNLLLAPIVESARAFLSSPRAVRLAHAAAWACSSARAFRSPSCDPLRGW